jgi:hypothetical protein
VFWGANPVRRGDANLIAPTQYVVNNVVTL